MKLVGIDESLLSKVGKACPGVFRAWMAEMREATWNSADEMLVHYPRCRHLGGCRFHFSMLPDDSGLRANVIFARPTAPGCVTVTGFASAPQSSAAAPVSRRQRSPMNMSTKTPTV
ncbi:hypothetical protein [Haloferula sargassicola]|uniref:Transposase n=1 Tax=Haloferula sargassicola TaxID=490096 RepID=A0ABP9UQN4_9BACT